MAKNVVATHEAIPSGSTFQEKNKAQLRLPLTGNSLSYRQMTKRKSTPSMLERRTASHAGRT